MGFYVNVGLHKACNKHMLVRFSHRWLACLHWISEVNGEATKTLNQPERNCVVRKPSVARSLPARQLHVHVTYHMIRLESVQLFAVLVFNPLKKK